MKALATILGLLFISLTVHAETTDDAGCRLAQREKIDRISALNLSEQELTDIYLQCRNSNSYYWFSTETYLTARSFGDNHETALREYYLYSNIGYTINQYKQMREITRGSGFQTTVKREILRSLKN